MKKAGLTTVTDSEVSVVRCKDYQRRRVEEAVRRSIELAGGLEGLVGAGDRVLLKVNLLAPAEPGAAVTTHPEIARSVAIMVMEAGGTPVIADAPGYLYAGGKGKALRQSGILDVARELGIQATHLENMENPFVQTDVPDARFLGEVMASRLALESDVIITLPKLKTHSGTWYTGAVKNMFGCVATKTRKQAHNLGVHERFAAAVVDIYSVMRPSLAVMDGVVGMEGEGPQHGRPRHAGVVLASPDPVALDAVASSLIGFDAGEILVVADAAARGLGAGSLEEIKITGERLSDVAVDFHKPSGRQINVHPLLMKLGNRLVKVQPGLNQALCTRCEICKKSCPVDVITMEPYPVIDRDRCIECFCCSEMCPEGAMEVQKNWLARRISR